MVFWKCLATKFTPPLQGLRKDPFHTYCCSSSLDRANKFVSRFDSSGGFNDKEKSRWRWFEVIDACIKQWLTNWKIDKIFGCTNAQLSYHVCMLVTHSNYFRLSSVRIILDSNWYSQNCSIKRTAFRGGICCCQIDLYVIKQFTDCHCCSWTHGVHPRLVDQAGCCCDRRGYQLETGPEEEGWLPPGWRRCIRWGPAYCWTHHPCTWWRWSHDYCNALQEHTQLGAPFDWSPAHTASSWRLP